MSVNMMKEQAKVVLDKFTEAAKDNGGWDVFEQAEVYLAADKSGSMIGYYNDVHKPVTHLAKQIAALALARLDPDGKIPFWLFGFKAHGPWTITAENIEPGEKKGVLGRTKRQDDIVTKAVKDTEYGSTNMGDAVRAIHVAHKQTDQSKPGLAVIQTDGQPDNETDVIDAIVSASRDNLFFVFIGYGNCGMPFLNKLNRGGFKGQVVDNVYAFGVGEEPTSWSDEKIWTEVLKEIPEWRKNATGKVTGTV
jgi:hypothetical protein